MAVVEEIPSGEADNTSESSNRHPSSGDRAETAEDGPERPEDGVKNERRASTGASGGSEEEEEEEEDRVEALDVSRPAPMRRSRCCILQYACCCLQLKHGAILIGTFQVAVVVLHLLMEMLYLAGVLLAGSYALNDDLTGNLPGDEVRWGSLDIAYASLSGIILLQELIALLFACLLVHGARTGRRGFVRAWLIFTSIMLAIDVGLWAARLTLEFMYYPARGGVLLIRAIVLLCFPAYFLLIVRSYYYEMLDEDEQAERGSDNTAPLIYTRKQPPPPYELSPPYMPTQRPVFPGGGGWAGPQGQVRPLETNLDDLQDGFGSSWQQTRRFKPLYFDAQHEDRVDEETEGEDEQQQREPRYPQMYFASSPSSDPQVTLRKSHAVAYKEEEHDYDEVAADEGLEADLEAARKRSSLRIPGAGRMVLPPLPPGARASLHPVPPPVTPSPPPSFRQPTLI